MQDQPLTATDVLNLTEEFYQHYCEDTIPSIVDFLCDEQIAILRRYGLVS